MKNILILLIGFIGSVYGLGCAPVVPATKYFPEEKLGVYSYFVKGEPVGVIEEQEYFLLFNLEPVTIAGSEYMRLWLLFENKSMDPILFEPLNFGTLKTKRISLDRNEIAYPKSPTAILAKISNEESSAIIAKTIGGALKAMAQRPSTVSSGRTVDDTWLKREIISDKTANEVEKTRNYYDAYLKSIDSGILRRNTVFPGKSINGCIYFDSQWIINTGLSEFSKSGYHSGRISGKEYRTSMDFSHVLEFELFGPVKSVVFSPIEGE